VSGGGNGSGSDNGSGSGKKLMPEILPAPQPAANAATPRERVNDRARLLLERFRALGTTAGAAILSLHCTYGTVDPLPPPPTQCSTLPDPFAALTATGQYDRLYDGGAPAYVFITISHYNTTGFTVSAVRVTAGGTLVYVDNSSSFSLIDIATDPSAAPDGGARELLFEVDIACGGPTTTLHFRGLLPAAPYANQPFTVERI
jgi:hypothetical protein